jgi:DNA-binding transcriptional LysR family regulator
MELRHLRYFTAVADETTLVAAAKRLGVAQPALTRQIHALEAELGVELLERRPKGIRLTPAGEVVLASARHVIGQVDLAAQHAHESSRGAAGRCVLCAGARALASGFVARLLARLAAQYPAIELAVTEGMMARQFRALQVGEADIGLGVAPGRGYPELASETLYLSMFDAFLIASTHPLSERPNIPIAELAGETFLTWGGEAASHIRSLIVRGFTHAKFKPARTSELEHLLAMTAAVAAGRGWTLMPNDSHAEAPPGTRIVQFSDFSLALPHCLLWRANEERAVVRTVMNVIRQLGEEKRGVARQRNSGAATAIVARTAEVRPSAVLELRHLRYFCAVADSGSFGRAAEQLELTQPALSRQVNDLERIIGAPLLARTARGVSTTAAGETFRRGVRRVLDEVASISTEAHRAHRGMIARCVVASVPTVSASTLVTALVQECARNVPGLQLEFEDLTTPAQYSAVREGRVDLGVCHASPVSAVAQRGIERTRLTTDTIDCALVSTSNPLASRESLTLMELVDVPFVFPDRAFQPAMYDLLFSHFERLAFQPRVEATYDGLRTIWALVAEGIGWCVGFASQRGSPPAGTIAIPIDHFSVPWGLDLLTREDESRSLILDVADRLIRLATEQD